MIRTMFDTTVARLHLNERTRDGSMYDEADAPTTFRRPAPTTGQLSLF
jgi:hypothetical protein